MKKILFLTFLILPICALATDMCARDDTMVFVFDPVPGHTGNGGIPTEWTWWVSFSYGRIAGDATCLSLSESLGQTAQGAYYGTGEYANTFISAEPGLSGTDINGNERKYCWYRMAHPVLSRWVLVFSYKDSATCISKCVVDSGANVGIYMQSRQGLFDSVGL